MVLRTPLRDHQLHDPVQLHDLRIHGAHLHEGHRQGAAAPPDLRDGRGRRSVACGQRHRAPRLPQGRSDAGVPLRAQQPAAAREAARHRLQLRVDARAEEEERDVQLRRHLGREGPEERLRGGAAPRHLLRAGHPPHRRLQRGHPDDREERVAGGAHHRDRGESDGGAQTLRRGRRLRDPNGEALRREAQHRGQGALLPPGPPRAHGQRDRGAGLRRLQTPGQGPGHRAQLPQGGWDGLGWDLIRHMGGHPSLRTG
mmetsp:Transcript_39499/g.117154  ORF Transcript_39499/g.117154 Transcript_39499/m.117154 type:complete len:256 (+) Transcript_39499:1013-1780(+)